MECVVTVLKQLLKGYRFDKPKPVTVYLNNADPILTKFDPHFIANS